VSVPVPGFGKYLKFASKILKIFFDLLLNERNFRFIFPAGPLAGKETNRNLNLVKFRS